MEDFTASTTDGCSLESFYSCKILPKANLSYQEYSVLRTWRLALTQNNIAVVTNRWRNLP